MARARTTEVHDHGLRADGNSGPIPEANSPGHHPDHEQDRPDLDAFAARFSGRDLDDLPTDTGVIGDTTLIEGAEALDDAGRRGGSGLARLLRRAAPVCLAAAAIAAIAAVIRKLVRHRRD